MAGDDVVTTKRDRKRSDVVESTILVSPRKFRLWLYTVSHSILLLRSVRDREFATRLDVLFKPVKALRMPTEIDGIVIRELDERGGAVPRGVDSHAQGRYFTLSDDADAAYVIAGTVAWFEDERGDFEPSHFSVPNVVW